MTDWRLPENRRELFQRLYSFHLKYKTHPGCVYFLLPDIAEHYDLDEEQRAWLVWLNGNTQNPAMSLLLGEASDWHWLDWKKAVDFWNDNFKAMEWDTDRRHQKGKFGEATEKWMQQLDETPASKWIKAGYYGWPDVWDYSKSQPYMGRLSAWSMAEYAKILLPDMPDADTLMLHDRKGSQSHRNGLSLVAGYDATYWSWEDLSPGLIVDLELLGEELLEEARDRNGYGHPDVGYLTMESALCTYKSMWKPDRRYPNVYADMLYLRLKKAESRFGKRFELLWESRQKHLPPELRLEDTAPYTTALPKEIQNQFRETGVPAMLGLEWEDMR